MTRTKSPISYLNHIYKPLSDSDKYKAYTRKMADTAICKAEEELLSEFIPMLEKVSAAFDSLLKILPAMKNEPLFAEVKELIKKYYHEENNV